MASLDGIEPGEPGEYGRDITAPIRPNIASQCNNRMVDLEVLAKSREGFRRNARGFAVYILCYCLRLGTHKTEDEILTLALKLGAECVEPLSEKNVIRCFKDSKRQGIISNKQIAKRLEMTGEEKKMELFLTPPSRTKTKGPSKQIIRRELIQFFMRRKTETPPASEVVEYLSSFRIKVDERTVRRDYDALSIPNPRSPVADKGLSHQKT
jgi:hypothetical protein